jgi:hypothetical protein
MACAAQASWTPSAWLGRAWRGAARLSSTGRGASQNPAPPSTASTPDLHAAASSARCRSIKHVHYMEIGTREHLYLYLFRWQFVVYQKVDVQLIY